MDFHLTGTGLIEGRTVFGSGAPVGTPMPPTEPLSVHFDVYDAKGFEVGYLTIDLDELGRILNGDRERR